MKTRVLEKRLEQQTFQFLSHHPYGVCFCLFVVPPVGVLLIVAVFSAIAMLALPLVQLLG